MDTITFYLPGILMAYSAFLFGIASPGPNVLAIMGTSMREGKDHGLALAMGIAVGSLSWALLTIIGLSSLLLQFPWALNGIKVFGGGYLIWLGYKSFRSASGTVNERKIAEQDSLIRYFLRGYLIQMTNPKAAMVWIAILSLGIQNDAPFWVGAAIVLGTFSLSVVIHAIYAIVFSRPTMMQLYIRAKRIIQTVLGGFFAMAGGTLLFEAIKNLSSVDQ